MDSKPKIDVIAGEAARGGPTGRPFIQVVYACAGAYQKVFRSVDGTHYMARCPTCGKTTRFAGGEGGVGARQFEIRC